MDLLAVTVAGLQLVAIKVRAPAEVPLLHLSHNDMKFDHVRKPARSTSVGVSVFVSDRQSESGNDS